MVRPDRLKVEKLTHQLVLQILLFDRSIGVVVQLSVIEAYGIMIFRTERNRSVGGESGSGGKMYVFRLTELEEFLIELMEWHHNVDMLLHNETDEVRLPSGLLRYYSTPLKERAYLITHESEGENLKSQLRS